MRKTAIARLADNLNDTPLLFPPLKHIAFEIALLCSHGKRFLRNSVTFLLEFHLLLILILVLGYEVYAFAHFLYQHLP